MKLHIYILLISFALLSACNDSGGSASNQAPTIDGNPVTSVRAEKTYSFTPTATDGDGDTLTFAITNKPFWADFDINTGTITGYPQMADYGAHTDIIITVSDGTDSASMTFTVDVLPIILSRDNFNTEGSIQQTADGYQSQGTLVMNVGGDERRFEESDLQLTFDAEGNLIDMVGETIVPQSVSDNLSLDAQVKTTVGLFTGAQINADPDLGITLKDELYYFVYYFGESLDITLGNRDGSGSFDSLTLETPLSGKLVLITDPSDVFYYYYAAIPFVGEAGRGESDHGFIPFIPQLDYVKLDSFDGHIIEKGSFSLGVKIFDFFNISGTRVIHQPEFSEIDFDNLLDSPIEYKMGINGDAEFSFAILGFGLFSFDLAKTSASLDVGLDRQQMAMQTVIAPDVSWVPNWFPVVPATETVGDWFINGDGSFSASLGSNFHSQLPEAMIGGTMQLDNNGVTLKGSVGSGDRTLGITATFNDNMMSAEVDVYADLHSGISDLVTVALDEKLDELQQAFDDLQQATGDYELELSLRGLRSSLPGIVDSVIPGLNTIPGTVRNEVDSAIVNYVNNYEVCVIVCTNPLDPLVNEQAIGDEKGEVARRIAIDAIAPVKAALNNLKQVANEGNDEVFRMAIKNALQQVYNHRVFSQTIRITHNFPLVGTITVYNRTITRTVLSTDIANNIKFALDNIDQLAVTSSIMISAQQIYDALPLEEAINTARQEVEQGLAHIPTLDGVGFTVDSGIYTAYANLDGKRVEIDINVLSPTELAAGIGRLISEQLF